MGESSERPCAKAGTLFPVLQNMVLFFLGPRPLDDRFPWPGQPAFLCFCGLGGRERSRTLLLWPPTGCDREAAGWDQGGTGCATQVLGGSHRNPTRKVSPQTIKKGLVEWCVTHFLLGMEWGCKGNGMGMGREWEVFPVWHGSGFSTFPKASKKRGRMGCYALSWLSLWPLL